VKWSDFRRKQGMAAMRKHHNLFRTGLLTAALLSLTASLCSAQAANSAKAATAVKVYVAARTPDGHPDLQGVWNTASLTPFQRAAQFASKANFTPEEAAAYERGRLQEVNRDRRDGGNQADLDRAYNEAWFDRGSKVSRTMHTSLIVDPADGHVPAMTALGKQMYEDDRKRFALHPADGPEDRPLPDRCIQYSQVGPPMLPGNYNDNYKIVQTPTHVSILAEMGYVVRVIPIDGRPHLPPSVRQWTGDPRGHWEGDTLVVESTNFVTRGRNRFGVVYDGPTDENLKVTERFTRVAADMILYRATVEDPTIYTRPWSVEVALSKTDDPVYEYACHEGNYGMSGILSGERVKEKKEGK
jgi:hypothetical protein